MNRTDTPKQSTNPPSMVRHHKTMRSSVAGGYQRSNGGTVDGGGKMKGMAPMKGKGKKPSSSAY